MSLLKEKPVRSKKYRDWVAEQPCMLCQASPAGDCHHGISLGYGEGGIGTKACDTLSLPLCRPCHQEMHANPELWADQWHFIAKTLQEAIKSGIIFEIGVKEFQD